MNVVQNLNNEAVYRNSTKHHKSLREQTKWWPAVFNSGLSWPHLCPFIHLSKDGNFSQSILAAFEKRSWFLQGQGQNFSLKRTLNRISFPSESRLPWFFVSFSPNNSNGIGNLHLHMGNLSPGLIGIRV